MSSEFFALGRVDFITIGAVGEPGERVFYLQAAQGELLLSLIIEKEHAAALSMGIRQLLEQLGGVPVEARFPHELDLREPIEPLFRVGSLGLGYDRDEDALILVARALVEEGAAAPEVHFWGSRAQMYALAERAAEVVMAGRPRCPLCNEPLQPDEPHNCIRGDGRKWLFAINDQ